MGCREYAAFNKGAENGIVTGLDGNVCVSAFRCGHADILPRLGARAVWSRKRLRPCPQLQISHGTASILMLFCRDVPRRQWKIPIMQAETSHELESDASYH